MAKTAPKGCHNTSMNNVPWLALENPQQIFILKRNFHFPRWCDYSYCQLTCWKLKWHVLLGMWHWGDTLGIKCRSRFKFVFVSENVTWRFGFEVEHQLKHVKHTHYVPLLQTCLLIMFTRCTSRLHMDPSVAWPKTWPMLGLWQKCTW